MLKICLVFWKSEPQYAYKRYAYTKNMIYDILWIINRLLDTWSINMGKIISSSSYFGSPKGSPKYGKTS